MRLLRLLMKSGDEVILCDILQIILILPPEKGSDNGHISF